MKSANKGSRRLKVLISRNSAGAIGGAELSALDQAAVLASLGHQVIFVSNLKQLKAKLPRTVKAGGWQSIESPKVLRPLRVLYLLPFAFVQAAYYAVKYKPDIINPHSREDQLAFTLTKFIHKSPVVWKNAGDLRYQIKTGRRGGLAGLTQKLLAAALRRTGHVYSLSQADNEDLLKRVRYLPAQKLSAIPSSILFDNYDTNAYLPSTDYQLSPTKIVIGTIIRLHKDKGVQDLIRAFRQLPADAAELWVIGEGEYRPQLEELAHGAKEIKFFGHQPDISQYLAAMDIFVQPAHAEPWGRNVKEAAYFGKAIIGANTGGIAQQVSDGATGLLFEPGNSGQLAKKLKLLMEDEKLRRKLGSNARKDALEQGDFRDIVEREILPLYKRAVGRKKLVVDATPVVRKKLDGIGRYSRNIVSNLTNDYHIELLGFVGDKLPEEYKNLVTLRRILIPRRLYSLLYKNNLAPTVGSKKDTVLYPNFVEYPRTNGKHVLIIHDLAYLTHPETLTPKNRAYLQRYVASSINKADKIVTISQATKQKLVKAYGIEPSKIDIAAPGIDPILFKPAAGEQIASIKKKYSLPEKYILFFGTLEPRKNIVGCIEAYMLLPEALRKRYGLVLAGGSGWQNADIQERVRKLQESGENIVTSGYIGDSEAPAVYSAASVFIFPSLDEGFGMPIIEAMACGTPVVTSGIDVLKETAGDAALFCDPLEPSDIAHKLERVLTDKGAADKLINAGYNRAQKFSWQESAQNTHEILKDLY